MVKHGWIEDDNMTYIIPRFEEYVYDKENPGVEIKIIDNTGNNNKTQIYLRKLKDNGLSEVSVSYSGGGDDGCIDDISGYTIDKDGHSKYQGTNEYQMKKLFLKIYFMI